jgi:hypothetical protein
VLIACDLLNGMIEGRFKESDSFGYSIEDLPSMDHAENLTFVRIRKTVQKKVVIFVLING